MTVCEEMWCEYGVEGEWMRRGGNKMKESKVNEGEDRTSWRINAPLDPRAYPVLRRRRFDGGNTLNGRVRK